MVRNPARAESPAQLADRILDRGAAVAPIVHHDDLDVAGGLVGCGYGLQTGPKPPRALASGNHDTTGGQPLGNDGAPDGRLRIFHLRLVRMSLPRPEETSQAVFFSSGNNVYVQVRHALAHAVVNRGKGAVRLHALFDGARQHLDIAEERRNEVRGKILERFIMRLGNQQRVPRKERTVVQERQRYVVLKNDIAFEIMRDHLAELTRRAGFHQLWTGPSPRLREAMMFSLRSSATRMAEPME